MVVHRAKALELELQRVAKAGDEKCLKQLMKRGANINAQDIDGWTALHAAAAEGCIGTVQIILAVSLLPSTL
jgi:ankyrin repeat protein